jgi:hypothetical protein
VIFYALSYGIWHLQKVVAAPLLLVGHRTKQANRKKFLTLQSACAFALVADTQSHKRIYTHTHLLLQKHVVEANQ